MHCGMNRKSYGSYWGIYNLREKQDKHYIESNFGDTNIGFSERVFNYPGNRNTIEGYWGHYDMMKAFIELVFIITICGISIGFYL